MAFGLKGERLQRRDGQVHLIAKVLELLQSIDLVSRRQFLAHGGELTGLEFGQILRLADGIGFVVVGGLQLYETVRPTKA